MNATGGPRPPQPSRSQAEALRSRAGARNSFAGVLERRAGALAVLFTLAVVAVRLWCARKVFFCGTPDSCYVLGLAQGLATHHRFYAAFLFDLQLPHLALPNTGIEYWRPGAALLLYLLRPFGALTLHGSLAVTTLTGVLWALGAWYIARRATASRSIALAAYALCLMLSPAWGGSITPDPTLLYAAAIAWFLALFTVRRQGLAQDILALVCVCVAYLVRNDAGLLLIPLVVVLWLRWKRTRATAAAPGASALYAAAMLAGFVLALVPMHLLYRHVLGTAFPPGASQALFLNDLSDFSSYGAPVSAHTLLATGLAHLVKLRIATAALILYRVLALVVGYVALIFLPALAVERGPSPEPNSQPDPERLPELAGAIAFGAAVLAVYILVLPAVGVFSALRSSAALLPVVSVVVIVAILRASRSRATAAVLAACVITAYAVSGFMDVRRAVAPMNTMGDADRAEAVALRSLGAGPQSVVMTPDPVQFSVTTGMQAIAMPGNGLGAITKEALELHPSYAILDGEHLPGTLEAVDQALHPVRTLEIPGQHVLLLELSPEPPR